MPLELEPVGHCSMAETGTIYRSVIISGEHIGGITTSGIRSWKVMSVRNLCPKIVAIVTPLNV